MSLEVKGARVIVRAPFRATQRTIDRFVAAHETWVIKHLAKNRERHEREREVYVRKLTWEEMRTLHEHAAQYLPTRVAYYAPRIGVTYGRITIRSQRTLWGSCSSKGNLNFNCLLMLTPPEVIDSIVVHELCHRREMNHSVRFYALVRAVCPDYDACRKWLKEHGDEIMRRRP